VASRHSRTGPSVRSRHRLEICPSSDATNTTLAALVRADDEDAAAAVRHDLPRQKSYGVEVLGNHFVVHAGGVIYNNTFDVGGAIGVFNAPAFNIGANSVFQSIRNNLFTAFVDVSSQFGRALVSTPDGSVSTPRVTIA
jgi:hypothetical protein